MANIFQKIPIRRIEPVIETGIYPAKGTVNEPVKISATVWTQNVKDILSVNVILQSPKGVILKKKLALEFVTRDVFSARVMLSEIGIWKFYIEAYIDAYKQTDNNGNVIINRYSVPKYYTKSDTNKIEISRKLAVYSSWYELFIRNYGAHKDKNGNWVSGTLKNAQKDIKRIANMGFNVIYITPISPIGKLNRRGKNNSDLVEKSDPGSPYAIGNKFGGHESIDPAIGTENDFIDYVKVANKLGIEIAYDIALQCSPDHLWVKNKSQYFFKKADATIAYAENPPKIYKDVYPLNFDSDFDGIYNDIKNIFLVWIKRGVTIFRVDNPHTKPLYLWERLIRELKKEHPNLIFLSEAKTHFPIMLELSKVGFDQSYTYYPWRTKKKEIAKYLLEISQKTNFMQRPIFWQNTPDELTPYMQKGGKAASLIRGFLAAMGSPSYGILSGYELLENTPRKDGVEEFDHSDKYEYKIRNFYTKKAKKMELFFKILNKIREENPSLQQLNNIKILKTNNKNLLCFLKKTDGAFNSVDPNLLLKDKSLKKINYNNLFSSDPILVLINLNPFKKIDGKVHLKNLPKNFYVENLVKKYKNLFTDKVNKNIVHTKKFNKNIKQLKYCKIYKIFDKPQGK
jgi:starch synthase (maltosyl-transferring)